MRIRKREERMKRSKCMIAIIGIMLLCVILVVVENVKINKGSVKNKVAQIEEEQVALEKDIDGKLQGTMEVVLLCSYDTTKQDYMLATQITEDIRIWPDSEENIMYTYHPAAIEESWNAYIGTKWHDDYFQNTQEAAIKGFAKDGMVAGKISILEQVPDVMAVMVGDVPIMYDIETAVVYIAAGGAKDVCYTYSEETEYGKMCASGYFVNFVGKAYCDDDYKRVFQKNDISSGRAVPIEEEEDKVEVEQTQESVAVKEVKATITKMEIGQEYALSGKEEGNTLMIQEHIDKMGDQIQIDVKTKYNTEVIEFYGIHTEAAYLIEDVKGCFLLLSTDLCSDDYRMYVYRIEEGIAKKVQEYNGLWIDGKSVISPEQIVLAQQLEVIGSYNGHAEYVLDETGALNRVGDMYSIEIHDSDVMWILTITQELPVEMDGEMRTLPVGAQIRLTGTDDLGVATFREEVTGLEGKIYFTKGDGISSWGTYIQGKQDMEYFEFVPYVG